MDLCPDIMASGHGLFRCSGRAGTRIGHGPRRPGRRAKSSAPAGQNRAGVIKAETNLVLVDVIATDKKGNYITDLEKKEFHVFEDDAEQPISSFSRESDIQPNAPDRQRYMVLFFDDSTMDPALQIQARQAGREVCGRHRFPQSADGGGGFQRNLEDWRKTLPPTENC